ncbi:MAG: hypothetical protein P4L16_00245 [Chlamydiales bacterium]|nr:hypothetical protein [Chlamydiales bacterium]
MGKMLLFYSLIFICSFTPFNNAKENTSSFVTYSLDGGRFGDQLVNYMKALWVSYKYEIPLLYRPFIYSDQLELSEAHAPLMDNENVENIRKIEIKDNLKFLEENRDDGVPTLYLISFRSHVLNDEDWENEVFRKKLTEVIRPKGNIEPIGLPSDRLTIAIHVRSQNNRFDTPLEIEQMPTKFPPHSFYLNGLKQIANHFEGHPLYVYIFTDDPQPQLIRDKYIRELKNWKIDNDVIIHCRESKNDHDINVLEDFFNMMQFDCVIHPDSMFSLSVCCVSGPIVEVTAPAWNYCRRDEQNHIIKDKEGNVIVDNLIYFRPEKGKPSSGTCFALIEQDMLF